MCVRPFAFRLVRPPQFPHALQIMHRCEDMILVCSWQGKVVECGDLFSVRRTDNGFCCSFNAVNLDEQL